MTNYTERIFIFTKKYLIIINLKDVIKYYAQFSEELKKEKKYVWFLEGRAGTTAMAQEGGRT